MKPSETIPVESSWGPPAILPLQAGDHLTRAEFERRYEAMPHVRKAELIEGEVYMPSPVSAGQHGEPHADLIGCFFFYRAYTPGVRVADNSTIRLGPKNEPQPDAALFVEPTHGGRVQFSSEGYIEGAPEAIGEVSASSVSIDLNKKFRVYQENQVQEYIVWRVLDKAIDWFVLGANGYERLLPGPDGIHRSRVFPGLWLDAQALVRSEMAKVLQILQQGIAGPDHAAFVAELQKKRAGKR